MSKVVYFFFNDTATTEIYTLSLHDALPIYRLALLVGHCPFGYRHAFSSSAVSCGVSSRRNALAAYSGRSEEHTSELQSRQYLVCRLLLEKKKKHTICPSSACYSPTPPFMRP